MIKRLAGYILKRRGWRFEVNTALPDKCVICVAPHTSNWDFIVGELAIRSVGMKAGFLMKDTWFFFPLNHFLKAIGGVPVAQHRRTNVTADVVESMRQHSKIAIAVTPEGTRSLNPRWHSGFLHIAHDAGVPVVLAYIDYGRRVACIDRIFPATGDPQADLIEIKRYYDRCGARGRNHHNFTTGLNEK